MSVSAIYHAIQGASGNKTRPIRQDACRDDDFWVIHRIVEILKNVALKDRMNQASFGPRSRAKTRLIQIHLPVL
jgi:hypothetical protein